MKKMKKIWRDQHFNQEDDNNLLSLEIQEKMIPTTLKISKEKYDGTSDLTDHISCFQTTLDLYDVIDNMKIPMFLATQLCEVNSFYLR